VTLPFHISQVDERGQYQQLFVFDVDAFYVYAFLLVEDVAELQGRSSQEPYYDAENWGTWLAEEDIHGTVGVDENPSLTKMPDLGLPTRLLRLLAAMVGKLRSGISSVPRAMEGTG